MLETVELRRVVRRSSARDLRHIQTVKRRGFEDNFAETVNTGLNGAVFCNGRRAVSTPAHARRQEIGKHGKYTMNYLC
jgi:hypothetical protein